MNLVTLNFSSSNLMYGLIFGSCSKSLNKSLCNLLSSVNMDETQQRLVADMTLYGSKNPNWFYLRKYKIGASKFGEICKARDLEKKSKRIWENNNKSIRTKGIMWGLENEPKALKCLEEY